MIGGGAGETPHVLLSSLRAAWPAGRRPLWCSMATASSPLLHCGICNATRLKGGAMKRCRWCKRAVCRKCRPVWMQHRDVCSDACRDAEAIINPAPLPSPHVPEAYDYEAVWTRAYHQKLATEILARPRVRSSVAAREAARR